MSERIIYVFKEFMRLWFSSTVVIWHFLFRDFSEFQVEVSRNLGTDLGEQQNATAKRQSPVNAPPRPIFNKGSFRWRGPITPPHPFYSELPSEQFGS